MAGKDKNIRTSLSGFLRYRRGKISDSERNSFERELQKDPFAAEAEEGFTNLTHDEIKEDMETLQAKLRSRTISKNRFIIYRIAASLIIVIGISSLMIYIQHNKNTKLVSEAGIPGMPIEISKGVALSESKSEKDKTLAVNQIPGNKETDNEAAKPPELAAADEKAGEKMEAISAEKKAVGINNIPEKMEAGNLRMAAAQPGATVKATEEKKDYSGVVAIRGKIISSEDNLPIPGATVKIKGTNIGTMTDSGGNFSLSIQGNDKRLLVADFIGMEQKEFLPKSDSLMNVTLNASSLALNEVVVVGYGVKRKSDSGITGAVSTIISENTDNTSNYIAPRPVNGKKEFDIYIRNNLRIPQGVKHDQKEIVVVSFIVKKTGEIDSIKIVRSPGKSFSDEAVRLIMEGPQWQPAEGNNIKIDEEVRLRIVFK